MKLLFVLGLIVTATALTGPAEAQNYPWCAHTSRTGGGMNCSFTTFEQCMKTASGMGGFCEQNTQYQPPAGSRAPAKTQKSRQD